MTTYKFDHDGKAFTVEARNYRTAYRRFQGYVRGELDIHGKTILARKRKKTPRNPDKE